MAEKSQRSTPNCPGNQAHIVVLTPISPPSCRESGAIAIMAVILLPVIIGFLALALETARLYNRKAEMQSLADAIAVSAAKQLDGTSDGVANALAAARNVVEGGYDLTMLHYDYGKPVIFTDAALKFAKSPGASAGWKDSTAAKAAPSGIAYVKVDTADISADFGKVDLWLMRVLSNIESINVNYTATAGRQRLNVTPLAICAMSKDPAHPIDERVNPGGYSELREYGFRRGASYNLLKLSPNSGSAVNYLLDPISMPPKSGSYSISTVGQYVCTGTVELPGVIGKTLNLQSGFPIDQLYNHLNSRFDVSNNACSAISAPPDSNVRQYTFASISWMTKPVVQVADATSSSSRLETIADLDPPNDQTPTHYGPLWTFSRAVPWSAYSSGTAEPPGGYTAFQASTAVWKNLYSTGPTVSAYPTDPKTGAQSPPYYRVTTAPPANPPGIKYRRVLNVPLLRCPAAGTPGDVVAIGKFFMTVPADMNGIYAEFAGATLEEEIAGDVELQR